MKRGKREKKHHIPMVNKKIAEMLVVCLPCHFDMGILPYHRARGTPLAVLYEIRRLLRCLLSACLVILIWGFFRIIGQGVPRWRFSMIHIYLE